MIIGVLIGAIAEIDTNLCDQPDEVNIFLVQLSSRWWRKRALRSNRTSKT